MDINQRIKEELEARIRKLEDFIADRGIGSTRLLKARKVQRNLNLAVFLGGVLTVAGITYWALYRNHDE